MRRFGKRITQTQQRPVYTKRIQENLDENIQKIQTQLNLYRQIKELAEDLHQDPYVQKLLRDTRYELRLNVRELQQTGYSVADLLSKFGAEIFKSQVLTAREKLSQEEVKGRVFLTDLFSEEDYLHDRESLDFIPDIDDPQILKQRAYELGLPQKQISKMTAEQIKNHPIYKYIENIARGSIEHEYKTQYENPAQINEIQKNAVEQTTASAIQLERYISQQIKKLEDLHVDIGEDLDSTIQNANQFVTVQQQEIDKIKHTVSDIRQRTDELKLSTEKAQKELLIPDITEEKKKSINDDIKKLNDGVKKNRAEIKKLNEIHDQKVAKIKQIFEIIPILRYNDKQMSHLKEYHEQLIKIAERGEEFAQQKLAELEDPEPTQLMLQRKRLQKLQQPSDISVQESQESESESEEEKNIETASMRSINTQQLFQNRPDLIQFGNLKLSDLDQVDKKQDAGKLIQKAGEYFKTKHPEIKFQYTPNTYSFGKYATRIINKHDDYPPEIFAQALAAKIITEYVRDKFSVGKMRRTEEQQKEALNTATRKYAQQFIKISQKIEEQLSQGLEPEKAVKLIKQISKPKKMMSMSKA